MNTSLISKRRPTGPNISQATVRGQTGRGASEAQKQAIALGKITGKTSQQVAKETGLAANTVRILQTRDPRTLNMMQQLRDQSHEKFAAMWLDAVDGLGKDIKSKDFNERRASRGQLLQFMTAGEPNKLPVDPTSGNADGEITLEQIVYEMRINRLKVG